MEEDKDGWQEVPALLDWICPECGTISIVEEWEICCPPCEDCGEHDGRRCPSCGEEFDHVWGAVTLAEAQYEREG